MCGAYSAQAVCSIVWLLLTALHAPDIRLIFLTVLAVGAARSFHGASARALVPNLVPAAAFANATAWRVGILQAAMMAGPVLGGLLYSIQPGLVFGVSALLQCLAALQISRINPTQARITTEKVTWRSLTAGFAFIRATPSLLGAVSLDLFAVLFGGATALLPIYARDILGTGPSGLGWLRAASAAGAMLTAVALLSWTPQRAIGKTLFVVVAIFGIATVGFGLSTSFSLSLLLLFIAGAADMVSMYIRSALVPLLTPDAMRGRVTAVEMVFIGASNELGAFESGLLAALVGPVPAVVLGGVATLCIAVTWRRLFPTLYEVDRLADLKPTATTAG
jgi:hypothetical protein